ncbi:MAG: enoyl-CoA hydratase/isomerase family protein [Variibacter sp.]|nr:enoyl-CoA hydratase/isomerase family protein [Variibacter sp.]
MIAIENVEAVRVLRLSHGRANALDLELVEALAREIKQAEADGAGAVVLTSAGHIFCAGVDLFRVVDGGPDYVRRFLPAFAELMFALFAVEVPLVAAASGHAIAGGAVLLAAADYRLMSDGEGKVGFTELQVGLPFPPAALEVIRFGVPSRRLQDVLFGAATYPCAEALALGLIDEVVEPARLVPRALEIAQRYAAPRAALALTTRQLRAATLARMREAERTFAEAVTQAWCAERTHALIRDYLARTVGRRAARESEGVRQ